jgi:S1-C subfamily serine protease
MRRASLYSSARPQGVTAAAPPKKVESKSKFIELFRKYRVPALAAMPGLAALVFVVIQWVHAPARQQLTQEDVDQAVTKSLDTVPLPSNATKAYEAVRGSVVRVRAFVDAPRDSQIEGGQGGEVESSIGAGVVILDKGVILTNIHVVQGAKRIGLTFADGFEADAEITGTRPEDDLAVLQAKAIPDDLQAATLQSTSGLSLGDHVTAVGFPFGIGPSVSSGVVSGLGREYRSPEGKRVLTNLIQFDAAANPGNSGGPLVNASGEVVGIVTGILNPTQQRVFIGIGFAVPIENAALAVGVPPF